MRWSLQCRLCAEIANARAEHVRIASSFDAATEDKQGRNALELASLVKLGLTPIEAIRAATTTTAELMGWQDSLGSIEKNRFADLIAGDGDPLGRHLDSAACLLVIKGGKQVKPVVPD